MFSPGALTAKAEEGETLGGVASHAEITACGTCHQPLKTKQTSLCLECHTDVQEQLTTANGLHAKLDTTLPCFECHSDHQGADFDPTLSGVENFDHSVTSFSLIWHQVDYNAAPLGCDGCHTGDDFSVNQQTCNDCHAAYDTPFMTQHQQEFGANCLECHDGLDRMTDFDHSQTDFPLEGQHATANCAGCHVNNQFEDLPAECVACHAEPAIHAGLFETTCESCHTTEAWSPATLGDTTFNHDTQTRFSLVQHQADFSGAVLNCASCHVTNLETVEMTICTTCHAQADAVFMASHEQEFGSDCLACHDGVDRMHDFDHARVFVLDGRHAEIECVACHADQKFTGTPAECVACHAEPPIHAGIFGVQCELCHSTTAWLPASLKTHTFPLDHGDEGMIACETCHVTTYVEYTCDNCHDPVEMKQEHSEEGISDITNCIECHPTGLEDEAESGGD